MRIEVDDFGTMEVNEVERYNYFMNVGRRDALCYMMI